MVGAGRVPSDSLAQSRLQSPARRAAAGSTRSLLPETETSILARHQKLTETERGAREHVSSAGRRQAMRRELNLQQRGSAQQRDACITRHASQVTTEGRVGACNPAAPRPEFLELACVPEWTASLDVPSGSRSFYK